MLHQDSAIAVLVTSAVSEDTSHTPSNSTQLCADAKPPGAHREIKAGLLLLRAEAVKRKIKDFY
jgi:hypothetical protein